MKKIISFFVVVFIAVFFCVPFQTYAADEYIYFTTTIHNWNHIDPITYPCGTFNSTVEFTSDTNHYRYAGCYNNTIVLNNYTFDDYSDIEIKETIRITDRMRSKGFYFLGLFGDSNEYSHTPIEEYLQRNYNNPGYFKVIESSVIDSGTKEEGSSVPDPAINEEESSASRDLPEEDYEIIGVDEATEYVDIEEGSTTHLGIVSFPNSYYLKYQFVVRGNLADPSGTFSYRFNEVEDYRTAIHGDSVTFRSNVETTSPEYMDLTLAELSRYLEEKPDVIYSDVYNAELYSVLFHTIGGEGYASILPDAFDEDSYGITLEVEARNDSEIANTGLLYDIGPYILLAIVFIGFLLVFKKNKIKEDDEELH